MFPRRGKDVQSEAAAAKDTDFQQDLLVCDHLTAIDQECVYVCVCVCVSSGVSGSI